MYRFFTDFGLLWAVLLLSGCFSVPDPVSIVASADTYISGFVVDSPNGAPISGAEVIVADVTIRPVVTGIDGSFMLKVPAGTYFDLVVSGGTFQGRPLARSRLQGIRPLRIGEHRSGIYIAAYEALNLTQNTGTNGRTYNVLFPPILEVKGLIDGEVVPIGETRQLDVTCRAANPVGQVRSNRSAPLRIVRGREYAFNSLAVASNQKYSARSQTSFLSWRWDSEGRVPGQEDIFLITCYDTNGNRVEHRMRVMVDGPVDAALMPGRYNSKDFAITALTYGQRAEQILRKPTHARRFGYDPRTGGGQSEGYQRFVRVFLERLFWRPEKSPRNAQGYRIYRSDNGRDGEYRLVIDRIMTTRESEDICTQRRFIDLTGNDRERCETRLLSTDISPVFRPGVTYWYRVAAYNSFGQGPLSDPKGVSFLDSYSLELVSPGSSGHYDSDSSVSRQELPVVDVRFPHFRWKALPVPGADIREDYINVTSGRYRAWGTSFLVPEPNEGRYDIIPDSDYPRNYAKFSYDPVYETDVSAMLCSAQRGGSSGISRFPGVQRLSDGELFKFKRRSCSGLSSGYPVQWDIVKSVAKRVLPVPYFGGDGLLESISYDGSARAYSFSSSVNGSALFFVHPDADSRPGPPSKGFPLSPGSSVLLSYRAQFRGRGGVVTVGSKSLSTVDYSRNYPLPFEIVNGRVAGGGVPVTWSGSLLESGRKQSGSSVTGYLLEVCVSSNPHGSGRVGSPEGCWPSCISDTCWLPLSSRGLLVDDEDGERSFYDSDPGYYDFSRAGGRPRVLLEAPTSDVLIDPRPFRVRVRERSQDIMSPPSEMSRILRQASPAIASSRPPPVKGLRLISAESKRIFIGWDPIRIPENPKPGDPVQAAMFSGWYGITIAERSNGQSYTPMRYSISAQLDSPERVEVAKDSDYVPDGSLVGFSLQPFFVLDHENAAIKPATTYYIRVFPLDISLYPNGWLSLDYESSDFYAKNGRSMGLINLDAAGSPLRGAPVHDYLHSLSEELVMTTQAE